ncbi:MAG: rRNA maturation RNase YbeY [Candidatus Omnitrophota bacterium]
MKREKNPRPKIIIKNNQKKIRLNHKKIAAWAGKLLRMKGVTEGELSILFTGIKRIQTLNRIFRRVNKPTDVLAFNMREGETIAGGPAFSGDIVICAEIARRSARIYQKSTAEEICLYLVHGILHLLGYDDLTSKDLWIMEKEQTRICAKLLQKGY